MLQEQMVEMSCNEPCLFFNGGFFQHSMFYIQELQCPLVDILTCCIQQHYSAFVLNVLPALLPLLRCNYSCARKKSTQPLVKDQTKCISFFLSLYHQCISGISNQMRTKNQSTRQLSKRRPSTLNSMK